MPFWLTFQISCLWLQIHCSEHLGYYFDETISTGFLQGYPVIEVDSIGEIDISAPDGLSTVFDDLGLTSTSLQRIASALPRAAAAIECGFTRMQQLRLRRRLLQLAPFGFAW